MQAAPALLDAPAARVRTDLVAGVITACVVVPQAIAYAGIAGLPAEAGLYVAFVPMLVYAVIGSSRVLSVSTTSTLSILTATVIVVGGDSADAAALLAIFAGGILLVAGLLRAGFLANLVSAPILAGFKAGTGLLIIVGQLGEVLGIPVDGETFIDKCVDVIRGLDDIQGLTLLLGAGTIVVLVLIKRFAPRVPGPLVAVVVGIALVAWFDLADRGVAVIGSVPGGLPIPEFPETEGWRLLVPAAMGVALLSFVESLAAGRALRHPDEPPIDANRELIALGAANVTGGFFRAFPAGGGLSQSAVNADAGARSSLAAIVTAGIAALVMTLFTGLLDDLAEATLGALVIVAAWGLIRPDELRRILRVRVRDGVLGIITLVDVLVFGVLQGILLAVLVSIGVLLAQANRMPVEVLVADEGGGVRPARHDRHRLLRPGLLALRLRGTLSFANVDRVTAEMLDELDRQSPLPSVLVVDLTSVPELEVTALDGLTALGVEVRARGVDCWLAGLDPPLEEMVARHGATDADRRFHTIEAAVEAFTQRTD